MLIIGIIALVFIGPDQIPETARTIGKFLNELRRATDGFKNQITQDINIPRSMDDFVKAHNQDNHQDPTQEYPNNHSHGHGPSHGHEPHSTSTVEVDSEITESIEIDGTIDLPAGSAKVEKKGSQS